MDNTIAQNWLMQMANMGPAIGASPQPTLPDIPPAPSQQGNPFYKPPTIQGGAFQGFPAIATAAPVKGHLKGAWANMIYPETPVAPEVSGISRLPFLRLLQSAEGVQNV